MGFLSSPDQLVKITLTEAGRKSIAEKGGLNFAFFSFSDAADLYDQDTTQPASAGKIAKQINQPVSLNLEPYSTAGDEMVIHVKSPSGRPVYYRGDSWSMNGGSFVDENGSPIVTTSPEETREILDRIARGASNDFNKKTLLFNNGEAPENAPLQNNKWNVTQDLHTIVLPQKYRYDVRIADIAPLWSDRRVAHLKRYAHLEPESLDEDKLELSQQRFNNGPIDVDSNSMFTRLEQDLVARNSIRGNLVQETAVPFLQMKDVVMQCFFPLNNLYVPIFWIDRGEFADGNKTWRVFYGGFLLNSESGSTSYINLFHLNLWRTT